MSKKTPSFNIQVSLFRAVKAGYTILDTVTRSVSAKTAMISHLHAYIYIYIPRGIPSLITPGSDQLAVSSKS